MKQYSVVVNFTFEPHGCDVEDDYDDEGELLPKNEEDQEKYDAFQRTDEYFEKNNVVKYIKKSDALGFVDSMLCNGEVVSARWLKNDFAIEMVVDTDMCEEELEEELRSNSLEDSEYEACGDTGWIVMTRGPKGEAFGSDGKWDMKHYWEYGLTDYRRNPIVIREIGEKPEIPVESDLFVVTEEGKKIHKQMGELKWKGVRFNEEDERKFKVLCLALKDPRGYPV
jgi:hypothetical protein